MYLWIICLTVANTSPMPQAFLSYSIHTHRRIKDNAPCGHNTTLLLSQAVKSPPGKSLSMYPNQKLWNVLEAFQKLDQFPLR
jgi:hypothetical protein